MSKLLSLLCCGLTLASPLIAGEIIAPLAVDDAQADTSSFRANAENLINDELMAPGKSELSRTTDLTKLWFTDSRGIRKDLHKGYFNSEDSTLPVLLFDLGVERTVSAVWIWNYALFTPGELQPNAARSIAIQLNTETAGAEDFDERAYAVELAPPGADGKPTVSPEILTIDPPVQARYLRLQITNNHFDAEKPGGDRVGLSKIRVQVEN